MAFIQKENFGSTEKGEKAHQYILTNSNGLCLKLLDYGARVLEVRIPDKKGDLSNITLRLDSLQAYEKHNAYFGATIGRYANRIADANFSLLGKKYALYPNNGRNHLHGGLNGFDKIVWCGRESGSVTEPQVEFSYFSQDGEEGYPGDLHITVTYSLNPENELKIIFKAITDRPTIVNLTNHSYWNLAQGKAKDVLGHNLRILADQYLPVNDDLIPIGKREQLKNSGMDFSVEKSIGLGLTQLKANPNGPLGFDHCYIIGSSGSLKLAASIGEPITGRKMEVWTTQPGLQFYSGNFLDGSAVNGGFCQYAGFCLEPESFPDSPNQPHFPSVQLNPGEVYQHTILYKFSILS